MFLTRHIDSHLSVLFRAILRAHIHSGVCPCHILQVENTRGAGSVLCSEDRYVLISFVMPGDWRPAGTDYRDGVISGQDDLFRAGVQLQTRTSWTQQEDQKGFGQQTNTRMLLVY